MYDDRYLLKFTKDKVYTNFRGLEAPKDYIKCETFTVIFLDYFIVYNKKYYMQLFLGNCTYKIVNKQMANYLDENLFED